MLNCVFDLQQSCLFDHIILVIGNIICCLKSRLIAGKFNLIENEVRKVSKLQSLKLFFFWFSKDGATMESKKVNLSKY